MEAERKGFFQLYHLAPEDEGARRLLDLALEALEERSELQKLRTKLQNLEAGPPFLKEGPSRSQKISKLSQADSLKEV